MLAWVHQSLASERELLAALFGSQDAAGAPGGGDAPSDMPSMPALLDRVFESICKPLKVCRTSTTPSYPAACQPDGACSCFLQARLQALSRPKRHQGGVPQPSLSKQMGPQLPSVALERR